jgi:hypothetical protein
MTINDFLARLDGARGNAARCPAHEDSQASLSVGEGSDGRILVKCHAGCSAEAIIGSLNLKLADLMPERERGKETVYPIFDTTGTLVAEHHRIDLADGGKRVWWSRNGKKGLGGLRLEDIPLYGSERVKNFEATKAIFVTEGEKAAGALTRAGFQALGTSTGASATPAAGAFEILRGREVVLWPDFDEPGRGHMKRIGAALSGIASSVRVLSWGEQEKDDAFDYFARGGTVEGVEKHAADAVQWGPIEVIPLAEILDSIVAFIRRFVVMSRAQLSIAALWVVHTHAIEAADVTAFLAATSAEKRSGKTRLLEILELLVREPLRAANLTVAVLYRAIDEYRPTLLFDEVDAIFGLKARGNEELRALINAGHSRGTPSLRMGGTRMDELQKFETFSARVLAAIGELPDTILDRSILIRMKRRSKSESVERFRRRDAVPTAAPLRQRISAWTAAHLTELRDARPIFPDGLSDRTEEGAEPLLSIADLAGGSWPERARGALVELCAGTEAAEDSAGLRLLRDVRSIFDESPAGRLSSATLCDRLNALNEAGWGGWNEGKGLKQRNLSRLLKPYGVESRNIRLDDGSTPKGFHLEQFEDAFSRYLSPEPGSERHTATGPINIDRNPLLASATSRARGGPKNTLSANNDGPRGGVADKTAFPEERADDDAADLADVGAL